MQKISMMVVFRVIPWGLEPQSKEPESFILSIELRNRCKDRYFIGNRKW